MSLQLKGRSKYFSLHGKSYKASEPVTIIAQNGYIEFDFKNKLSVIPFKDLEEFCKLHFEKRSVTVELWNRKKLIIEGSPEKEVWSDQYASVIDWFTKYNYSWISGQNAITVEVDSDQAAELRRLMNKAEDAKLAPLLEELLGHYKNFPHE